PPRSGEGGRGGEVLQLRPDWPATPPGDTVSLARAGNTRNRNPLSPISRKAGADDQADATAGPEGPGGPPPRGRAAPDARPVPPGPAALRQVLPPLRRHPPRLLQEPHHREDDVAAPRPGPRVRPQGLGREDVHRPEDQHHRGPGRPARRPAQPL